MYADTVEIEHSGIVKRWKVNVAMFSNFEVQFNDVTRQKKQTFVMI